MSRPGERCPEGAPGVEGSGVEGAGVGAPGVEVYGL